MKNGSASFLIVFFLVLLTLVSGEGSLFSESVRARATSHFSSIDWTTNRDSSPAVEIPGTTIPGGDESFPILGSDNATGVPALYPEIDRLGKIDYTGIDEGLLTLLKKVCSEIKSCSIDTVVCRPERSFIATLATFQLKKIASPVSVVFSRPSQIESGEYAIVFRIAVKSGDKPIKYAFVNARTSVQGGSWYLDDFIFDGESYAAILEQN
jgi:hypothetical protein